MRHPYRTAPVTERRDEVVFDLASVDVIPCTLAEARDAARAVCARLDLGYDVVVSLDRVLCVRRAFLVLIVRLVRFCHGAVARLRVSFRASLLLPPEWEAEAWNG